MTTETVLTNDQIMEQFELHIDDLERFRGCSDFARAIEQAVLQSPDVQRLRRLAKTLDEKIEAYERYGPICTFESDAMIHATHLYELLEAMDGTQ